MSAGLSSSSSVGALVIFDIELPLALSGFLLVSTMLEGASSGPGESWRCAGLGCGDVLIAVRGPTLEAGMRIAKDPAFGIILIPFAGERDNCGTGTLAESKSLEVF